MDYRVSTFGSDEAALRAAIAKAYAQYDRVIVDRPIKVSKPIEYRATKAGSSLLGVGTHAWKDTWANQPQHQPAGLYAVGDAWTSDDAIIHAKSSTLDLSGLFLHDGGTKVGSGIRAFVCHGLQVCEVRTVGFERGIFLEASDNVLASGLVCRGARQAGIFGWASAGLYLRDTSIVQGGMHGLVLTKWAMERWGITPTDPNHKAKDGSGTIIDAVSIDQNGHYSVLMEGVSGISVRALRSEGAHNIYTDELRRKLAAGEVTPQHYAAARLATPGDVGLNGARSVSIRDTLYSGRRGLDFWGSARELRIDGWRTSTGETPLFGVGYARANSASPWHRLDFADHRIIDGLTTMQGTSSAVLVNYVGGIRRRILRTMYAARQVPVGFEPQREIPDNGVDDG